MSRNYKPKTSLLDAILGEEVSGMTSFGKVIVIMGLLFFILGKFILFIVPILLLISTFYFLVRKNALKGNFSNQKIQDFWLTEEEKNSFIELDNQRRAAYDKIYDLENKSEGLSRNKDGTISNRSNLGKEINQNLSLNYSILSKTSEDYFYLKELPQKKWKSFLKVYSIYGALFSSLLLWFISFFILRLIFPSDDYLRTSFILEVFSIDVSENTIKAKTIATVISVLSFLIGYFIYSQLFKANYEMPPEVDSENVNLY